MKTLVLILALLSTSVFAGQNQVQPKPVVPAASQKQQQQQQQQQESTSQATNAGNNQTITITTPGTPERQVIEHNGRQEVIQSGKTTIRNVPSVSGPPLVASNDTCMGSLSGSVNVPGFGVSAGATWTDANCVMLKNSRELWNMGMKAAALARMCMDGLNREALELTDFECPQTARERARGNAAPAAAAPQVNYTDPIVRARLGLPPLPATK